VYEKCFLLHLSCNHLQSEYVEVEGMDMLGVKGMNMVKELNLPSNHRLMEEGMNMTDISMWRWMV
jgi:hypothetical protein